MAKPCLVYGRPDCEDTQRALELLDHRGVTYDFFNINEDGDPEPLTLHAGLPTTQGEKWIFSQWVRDRRPQPA